MMDTSTDKSGQQPNLQGYSQPGNGFNSNGYQPGYGFNNSYPPPSAVYSQPTSQQQTNFVYTSTSSSHVAPIGQQTSGTAPRDWLVPAILVTFFCAWPLGIFAIIQASKSRTAVQRRDYGLAESAARSAKQFIIFAVVVGVIGWTLLITSIVVRIILRQ